MKLQYLLSCTLPGTNQTVREVKLHDFFDVNAWVRSTPGRPNAAAAYCDVLLDWRLVELNLAHSAEMFGIYPPFDEFARGLFVGAPGILHSGGATSIHQARPAMGLFLVRLRAIQRGTAEFRASLDHCYSPQWDTWISGENGRVDPAEIGLGTASVVIR